MKIKFDPFLVFCASVAFFILLCLYGAYRWERYTCEVQSEAYARQGLTITPWEVWIGIKPAGADPRK